MHPATLRLVGFRAGFRPGHSLGVHGSVPDDSAPDDSARCRDNHAHWLRDCADHPQLGRLLELGRVLQLGRVLA
jgi:hypothetical protein